MRQFSELVNFKDSSKNMVTPANFRLWILVFTVGGMVIGSVQARKRQAEGLAPYFGYLF